MITKTTTTVLKIRKFKTKLPDDFVQLVSIETGYPLKTFLKVNENEIIGNRLNQNLYYIGKDEIFFCGQYSKIAIVKWMQFLKEWAFPQKIILKYIYYK